MSFRQNLSKLARLSAQVTRHQAQRGLAQAAANTEHKPQPLKTCLYDFHLQHGGKIVDFAGFLMPVQYKDLSLVESHLHTRSSSSLFDVSHMMQTRVHGRDRFKFIESLTVSDIAGLRPDSGSLTVFTNEKGGIVDDLIVSNTSLNYLYIVSNAGCADKDFAHLKAREQEMRANRQDVTLERVEDMALLAVQGPKTAELLQTGVSFDVKKLGFMSTIEAAVFGIPNCRVTRCGYTGEDGVEISVPRDKAARLATQLLEYKNGAVCKLAGLGARDTLRLEAGLCLYGNDIDDTRTPIEAGLAWLVSKRRREEKNFPGAQVVLQQLAAKPAVRRVGFALLGKNGPSARQHYKIYDAKSSVEIGEVTSGCLSPSLKKNIAMGYVDAKFAKLGTPVVIDVRNKKYEAEVVKMPFVPHSYYKN
jgi:aminomethyltransferase